MASTMPTKARKGETNPNAKLTAETALAIRAALANGATLRAAAASGGISITNAWLIKHGHIWAEAR